MCIVIDTNVFGSVFDPNNAQHLEYHPVNKWVTEREGFMVLGGTRYIEELRQAKWYLGVLTELSRKGRVKRVRDDIVDRDYVVVEELLKGSRCDDCHLIAVIRVSGCRLICSNDRRADQYLKNPKLYPKAKGLKPPSIYRYKKHSSLLCRKNIVSIRNLA